MRPKSPCWTTRPCPTSAAYVAPRAFCELAASAPGGSRAARGRNGGGRRTGSLRNCPSTFCSTADVFALTCCFCFFRVLLYRARASKTRPLAQTEKKRCGRGSLDTDSKQRPCGLAPGPCRDRRLCTYQHWQEWERPCPGRRMRRARAGRGGREGLWLSLTMFLLCLFFPTLLTGSSKLGGGASVFTRRPPGRQCSAPCSSGFRTPIPSWRSRA